MYCSNYIFGWKGPEKHTLYYYAKYKLTCCFTIAVVLQFISFRNKSHFIVLILRQQNPEDSKPEVRHGWDFDAYVHCHTAQIFDF